MDVMGVMSTFLARLNGHPDPDQPASLESTVVWS